MVSLRSLLLFLLLCLPVVAEHRVTMECSGAPLPAVLREVAHSTALELKLDPTAAASKGVHTLKFKDQSLELAMVQVLKNTKLAWHVQGRLLVVGSPDFIKPYQKPMRQQILLERTRADEVMAQLERRYPAVEMIPHPTMNGFYAVGPTQDIKNMIKEIPAMDGFEAESGAQYGAKALQDFWSLLQIKPLPDLVIGVTTQSEFESKISALPNPPKRRGDDFELSENGVRVLVVFAKPKMLLFKVVALIPNLSGVEAPSTAFFAAVQAQFGEPDVTPKIGQTTVYNWARNGQQYYLWPEKTALKFIVGTP